MPVRASLVAVVIAACVFAAGCCGPCGAPCIPGVWPAVGSKEAHGDFRLTDDERIEFSARSGKARINLQRVAERDHGLIWKWKTLDSVEAPWAANQVVCVGDALVAITENDAVRFAWTIDMAAMKLVPDYGTRTIACSKPL